MSGRRSRTSALLVPAWALASLAAAVFAHALIDGLGALLGADADAYDARPHGAVAPAVLFGVALGAAALLKVAAGAIARRERRDPIELLARRFGAMRPAWPLLAVACGAFATLMAMEFSEQIAAVGHIEGVADALGGVPAFGLGILLATSAIVTLTGLRTARALVGAARTVAIVVFERFAWRLARPLCPAARRPVRALQRRPAGPRATLLARSRGLRAPPLAA